MNRSRYAADIPFLFPNTQLPPTRSDFSKQSNSMPRSCRAFAAAMPDEPAPMMQALTPPAVRALPPVTSPFCPLISASVSTERVRPVASPTDGGHRPISEDHKNPPIRPPPSQSLPGRRRAPSRRTPRQPHPPNSRWATSLRRTPWQPHPPNSRWATSLRRCTYRTRIELTPRAAPPKRGERRQSAAAADDSPIGAPPGNPTPQLADGRRHSAAAPTAHGSSSRPEQRPRTAEGQRHSAAAADDSPIGAADDSPIGAPPGTPGPT